MGQIRKVTLIGFIIGILGIFGPIIWDIYKSQSELEIKLDSINTIFNQKNSSVDLEVYYKNRKIENLYKNKYIIKNLSSIAIKHTNILSPLTLEVNNPNAIVSIAITEKNPPDLDVTFDFNNTTKKITLNSSLLNPNDYFILDIFTQSSTTDFNVSGRINQINIIKNSSLIANITNTSNKKPSKKLYFGLMVIGLFFLIFISYNYYKELYTKYLFKHTKFKFPKLDNRILTRMYIKSRFSYLSNDNDLQSIYELLDNLPDRDNYSQRYHNQLTARLEKIILHGESNLGGVIVFFILFLIGLIGYTLM